MAVLQGNQMYSDDDVRVGHGDKRKHLRYATRLKALYYLTDEHEGLEKCEIVNVGYGGVCLQFDKAATFKDSRVINLGVVVKWQLVPISLKGRVTWLSEKLKRPIGGVELNAPLDNMTLLKLL